MGALSSKNKASAKDEDVFSKAKLIKGLKDGKFQKIVIMTGAGISVSAGIPDFRSPDTGLYANLKKYDLPFPEAIFDIAYFQKHPEAFYKLAGTFLDLDTYDPTPTHYFCKLLQDKGIVLQYMTQNIDNLEEKTGWAHEDICQAHGANFGASCCICKEKQSRDQLI